MREREIVKREDGGGVRDVNILAEKYIICERVC